MKLQIHISEAMSLIKAKNGADVTLKIVDEKTLKVGYVLRKKVKLIGEISKNVVINLTIEKLVGETLYLAYAVDGIGMDLILKGILTALPSFSNQRLIKSCENNSLIIHLNEIEQVHNALQQIEIDNIAFRDDMAIVDFRVKA